MNKKTEFGRQIALLNRRLLKYINQELHSINVTSSEYIYLLVLSDQDNVTQDQLTKIAAIDKAQTTRALKSLEVKGYIERKQKDTDKRSKLVSLTENGRKIVPSIKKKIKKWEEMLQTNIPPNYIDIIEMLLKTMIENTEGEHDE